MCVCGGGDEIHRHTGGGGGWGPETPLLPTIASQERHLASQNAQIKREVLQMKEQGVMI